MKFMKPCWVDIKISLALQQDVWTYAGKLVYGVRLQMNMNVGDRLTKKEIFQCVIAFTLEKRLRKWVSCRMYALEKVVRISIFL